MCEGIAGEAGHGRNGDLCLKAAEDRPGDDHPGEVVLLEGALPLHEDADRVMLPGSSLGPTS